MLRSAWRKFYLARCNIATSHPKSYSLIVAIRLSSYPEKVKPIQAIFVAIIRGEIRCDKFAVIRCRTPKSRESVI